MTCAIIITIIVVAAYLYYQSTRNKSKVPPGCKEIPEEPGLPIIGVLHKAENPLCNYFVKLSKKHGPIFQVKLGMRNMVVLSSFKYIKEALVTNGDTFAGRWKLMKYIMGSTHEGLVFVDGNMCSEQKSFILKTLKDFGIGRSRSVEIVQDEALHLLEDLGKLNAEPVHFANFVSIYTENVICKFIMNKRYGLEDPEIKIMDEIMDKLVKHKDPVSLFALMFPFLDNNEWIMKFIVWITGRKALFERAHEVYWNVALKHLSKLDFNSEGDDLIDRFLIRQHQLKEKTGDVGTFTDKQLMRNMVELLMAGYDTNAVTFGWAFMLLSLYPDVQNRVHKEIEDLIGNERIPNMNDKKSLNYVQAVMDEVLRISSIVPLSVFHRAFQDCYIDGYFLPKDTLIATNLFASSIDPNIWEKPLEFYPEHFLKMDENQVLKYSPREELIPFSMGKRQCLGESLARMENFIYFTCILQRFRVSFPDGLVRPTKFDVFDATEGLIRTNPDSVFIFTKR